MEKRGHEWLVPVTAEPVDHPLTVIGRGTCQSSEQFSLIKGALQQSYTALPYSWGIRECSKCEAEAEISSLLVPSMCAGIQLSVLSSPLYSTLTKQNTFTVP